MAIISRKLLVKNAYRGIIYFIIFYFFSFIIYIVQSYSAFSHADIVISRYKEPMTYLDTPLYHSFRKIYLYNKGPDIIETSRLPSNVEVINLPNVGCEGHTYLYHIIYNYHQFSDKTFFIPGSIHSLIHRNKSFNEGIKKILFLPFLCSGSYISSTVLESNKDFSVSYYQHSSKYNKQLDSSLSPCQERPFGTWYEKNFPERTSYLLSQQGLFMASREILLKNDIETYKNLITYLENDRNPEAGHYMERSWAVLFYQ